MLYLNFNDLPQDYETMFFPGGEPHVKVPLIEENLVFVRAAVRSFNDFGLLLCLLNAIQTQGKAITLFIPYFPGARQDRNPEGTTPLTVDIYARALSLYVDHLMVFDPHSPAAVHYISRHFPHVSFLYPFQLDPSSFTNFAGIIAPDTGAISRAMEFRNKLFPNAEFVVCEKKRDFHTGKILGYHMPELTVAGEYLVVDDICDGGWTFTELAKAFAADPLAENSSLCLYVSHGIFSKGLDDILGPYEYIYTTDSLGPFTFADVRFKTISLAQFEAIYV